MVWEGLGLFGNVALQYCSNELSKQRDGIGLGGGTEEVEKGEMEIVAWVNSNL